MHHYAPGCVRLAWQATPVARVKQQAVREHPLPRFKRSEPRRELRSRGAPPYSPDSWPLRNWVPRARRRQVLCAAVQAHNILNDQATQPVVEVGQSPKLAVQYFDRRPALPWPLS